MRAEGTARAIYLCVAIAGCSDGASAKPDGGAPILNDGGKPHSGLDATMDSDAELDREAAIPDSDAAPAEAGVSCIPVPLADAETLTEPLGPPALNQAPVPPIAFGEEVPWMFPTEYANVAGGLVMDVSAAVELDGQAGSDLLIIGANAQEGRTYAGLTNGDGTFRVVELASSGKFNYVDFGERRAPIARAGGLPGADFNGDSMIDGVAFSRGLKETDYAPSSISLSDGDASYKAVPWPTVANDLRQVGDFNGDAAADLYRTENTNCGLYIRIAISNRDGTFAEPVRVPVAALDFSAFQDQVSDVNGDGRADLLMIARSTTHSVVYTALSRADGTFDPVVRTATPSSVATIYTPVDLNGDHAQDLLAWARSDAGLEMSTLLSRLDGTFSSEVVWNTPNVWSADPWLTWADFNGDGRMDVSVSGGSGPHLLFAGLGDGKFGAAFTVPTYTSVVGDVNGDGRTDLVGRSGTVGPLEVRVRFAN